MGLKKEISLWTSSQEHWRRNDLNAAIGCCLAMQANSKILFNLGVMYYAVEDLKFSGEYFSRAVQRDRYFTLGYLALGKVYFQLGSLQKAKEATIHCIDSFRLTNCIDYSQLGMGGMRISKSDVLLELSRLCTGKEAFSRVQLDRIFELASWKRRALKRKEWLGESKEIVGQEET